MFSPKLMPDTTRSGRFGMPCSSMAQMTVSAGNPATALAGYPPAVIASVAVRTPPVTLGPVPLWLVSGATTVTLVCGSDVSALTVASMPGAVTPSSFVTRIVRVDDALAAAPALSARNPDAVSAASVLKTTAGKANERVRRCIPVLFIGPVAGLPSNRKGGNVTRR
jgi:hypothetical protein